MPMLPERIRSRLFRDAALRLQWDQVAKSQVWNVKWMAANPDQGTLAAPELAQPLLAPRWNVVLLDDDDHTYEYVVDMLVKLFSHSARTAYALAVEVDKAGRSIVETTSLERAELKRDQIHSYGADPRLERSKGSMSAVLEPAH